MWNLNRLTDSDRLDAIAEAIQFLCLLVTAAINLMLFLLRDKLGGFIYNYLDWYPVRVSVVFLAASLCRKQLRQSKWYFLAALLMVGWFYVVRSVHLRLEMTAKEPGTFVCAYLLCFPFAAATGDGQRQRGLKLMAMVFAIAAAAFAGFAGLLVFRRLPQWLDGYVFWDGARFGVMGHPNICATILMIGAGLTAGFAARTKRLWIRILLLILIALEFGALSLTNGRTAIILSCLMFGGIMFCILRKPGWKRCVLALAAAVAVMVCLFSVSRALYSKNEARLTELARQSAQTGEETGLALNGDGTLKTENEQGDMANNLKSLNGRTVIWTGAVKGIRANPRILLVGTENAGPIISQYSGWTGIQHAHNSWVEVLYQLGLPGLLAALALTVMAVWNAAVLLWRNADLWKSIVTMVVLCLLGCAILEPYLFVANVQYHYFDFLFLMCVGYMRLWSKEKGNATYARNR